MIAFIVLGAALVLAVVAGVWAVRELRARVAALESSTDAAQRWQDEVRKAIAAGR